MSSNPSSSPKISLGRITRTGGQFAFGAPLKEDGITPTDRLVFVPHESARMAAEWKGSATVSPFSDTRHHRRPCEGDILLYVEGELEEPVGPSEKQRFSRVKRYVFQDEAGWAMILAGRQVEAYRLLRIKRTDGGDQEEQLFEGSLADLAGQFPLRETDRSLAFEARFAGATEFISCGCDPRWLYRAPKPVPVTTPQPSAAKPKTKDDGYTIMVESFVREASGGFGVDEVVVGMEPDAFARKHGGSLWELPKAGDDHIVISRVYRNGRQSQAVESYTLLQLGEMQEAAQRREQAQERDRRSEQAYRVDRERQQSQPTAKPTVQRWEDEEPKGPASTPSDSSSVPASEQTAPTADCSA